MSSSESNRAGQVSYAADEEISTTPTCKHRHCRNEFRKTQPRRQVDVVPQQEVHLVFSWPSNILMDCTAGSLRGRASGSNFGVLWKETFPNEGKTEFWRGATFNFTKGEKLFMWASSWCAMPFFLSVWENVKHLCNVEGRLTWWRKFNNKQFHLIYSVSSLLLRCFLTFKCSFHRRHKVELWKRKSRETPLSGNLFFEKR